MLVCVCVCLCLSVCVSVNLGWHMRLYVGTQSVAWTQSFEWSPALGDRAAVLEWRDWPSIAWRTSLQCTLLTPCLLSLLPLLNPLVPLLLSLPPIPCCLAPRARRPRRCTHALPHCVKLFLLVCVCVHAPAHTHGRVWAWQWAFPCMCVSLCGWGSADKRSNHLSFLPW